MHRIQWNARKGMLLTATAIAQVVSTAAFAQNDDAGIDENAGLDVITVTAQGRERGLQDTPISIAAVSADKLTDTALQSSQDLQFFVPNFTFTETGIGTNIFIRGVGSGINQAFEQSVGQFIDNVNFPRAQQTRAPFLDLERVEVLRGPQAILLGKNAVAGALNITTARPKDEFEGYILGSYEFLDEEYIIEGAVNIPLSERARVRLAGRTRDANGFVENPTLQRSEPQRDDWTIRATGEFDVTDTFLARAKVEVSQFDTTGRSIEIFAEAPIAAGPFTGLTFAEVLTGVFGQDASVLNNVQDGVRSSNGDFSNNEQQLYQLDLIGSFGDFEVRSTSAFQNLEYDELCDCDFTGATIFDAGLQEQYQQFSQEIRVVSPIYDRFDYVTGVYFQTSDHDFADQINVPGNSVLIPATMQPSLADTAAARIATTNSDFYSIFAQVNFRPVDRWELQLGGRLSHEVKDGSRTLSIVNAADLGPLSAAQAASPIVFAGGFGIASTNLDAFAAAGNPTAQFLQGSLGSFGADGIIVDDLTETRFSPDVKLVWEATDDLLLYASWARGFKSGGFDFRANNRSVSPTLQDSFAFDDERATNVELGGKYSFLGGSAELNFALYYTQFDDLQISIFDGVLGFNVGNAASSEVFGLEVDGRWAPTDFLTLSGSASYTDFEFSDFENAQCFFGATPDVDFDGDGTPELCDASGETNQLVSDFQGIFISDLHFPIFGNYEISSVTDVFFTTEYNASNLFDPNLVQEAYANLNTRISFGPNDDTWQLALLAKNLTDVQALQFAGNTPLAGSSFGAQSNYGFFNQGRQLWLQAQFKF